MFSKNPQITRKPSQYAVVSAELADKRHESINERLDRLDKDFAEKYRELQSATSKAGPFTLDRYTKLYLHTTPMAHIAKNMHITADLAEMLYHRKCAKDDELRRGSKESVSLASPIERGVPRRLSEVEKSRLEADAKELEPGRPGALEGLIVGGKSTKHTRMVRSDSKGSLGTYCEQGQSRKFLSFFRG